MGLSMRATLVRIGIDQVGAPTEPYASGPAWEMATRNTRTAGLCAPRSNGPPRPTGRCG